jgi:hypothetical protein
LTLNVRRQHAAPRMIRAECQRWRIRVDPPLMHRASSLQLSPMEYVTQKAFVAELARAPAPSIPRSEFCRIQRSLVTSAAVAVRQSGRFISCTLPPQHLPKHDGDARRDGPHCQQIVPHQSKSISSASELQFHGLVPLMYENERSIDALLRLIPGTGQDLSPRSFESTELKGRTGRANACLETRNDGGDTALRDARNAGGRNRTSRGRASQHPDISHGAPVRKHAWGDTTMQHASDSPDTGCAQLRVRSGRRDAARNFTEHRSQDGLIRISG